MDDLSDPSLAIMESNANNGDKPKDGSNTVAYSSTMAVITGDLNGYLGDGAETTTIDEVIETESKLCEDSRTSVPETSQQLTESLAS